MLAYILRRLLLVIPTLLGILIVNFAVVQVAPGGPVERLIAEIQGDARLNLEILGRLGISVVEITDEQAWELHFSEIGACGLKIDRGKVFAGAVGDRLFTLQYLFLDRWYRFRLRGFLSK